MQIKLTCEVSVKLMTIQFENTTDDANREDRCNPKKSMRQNSSKTNLELNPEYWKSNESNFPNVHQIKLSKTFATF